ncbi:cytochrome P460 [Trinickia terrae]|uniref:Cytochrome P460 n=1 Tax=Trinickia terrae TaxID=2571161 RepID=A0A4U1HYF7_9BURK|nr:VTT domain-containing protein [Trinickia terrae]TKC85973.1 cytochrome P460 [Trinickia terrae]
MNALSTSAIANWGAAAVFLNVLLTRLGVPIPAVPTLVVAGTAIASGALPFWSALLGAVAGALAGDGVWFAAGRRYGERVFDALGRLSPHIEVPVRTARSLFERFGVSLTAVSKFVPGLAFITPPLMGTTRVDARIYVAWDLASAASWAAFWLLGGVLVHKELHLLLSVVRAHDATLIDVAAAVLAGYFALRLVQRWRVRRWIARRRRALASAAPEAHAAAPVILDARAEPIRSLAAHRIPCARPLDLSSADKVDEALMADDAVVYCVCSDHASAREVGRKMREKGFTRVRTVKGGLDAWRRRGYPIETPPAVGDGADEVRSPDAPHEPAHENEPMTVRCIAPKRPSGS